MFPSFPEPLLLEHPSGESFILDVRKFVSIPDLMQFTGMIYADWGYYCGQSDAERGEESYLGKWLLYQPEATVGHRQSRSTVFWFWVQLDYEGAVLHEFNVGALNCYLTA